LNILLLCEGDAESWTPWSGICKSLVDHLRLSGHTVEVGDVDLHGADRYVGALTTFSPRRRRWGTRFHLGAVPFWLRSHRANSRISSCGRRPDVVIQIGATFQIDAEAGVPYCLCCDSNIRVAQQGAPSGFSDAAALSEAEVNAIARREEGVYRDAAAIFPLSENLRRSFVEDFSIPAARVRAIYAGPNLDPGRLSVEPPVHTATAREPTALFVGLQFHRKGGDLLLESFRRVRTALPSARLVIVGVPKDSIGEPGVDCIGEFDKNTPEGLRALVAAYQSADVFVLPTRFEPFGIAFVEAMHFGLPCIGPSAWAVPEIISNGETGFTVPPEDAEALADRLLYLLSDRAMAEKMGQAARARARSFFTWPHAVSRMNEVLSQVTGSRS